MIFVGYILAVVFWVEMEHKTLRNKAGYLYFLSLTGISDVIIVVQRNKKMKKIQNLQNGFDALSFSFLFFSAIVLRAKKQKRKMRER